MTVTYTIPTLERSTTYDGVITAHWRASDSEEVGEVTHTGSSYGTCSFTPDPTAAGYIAYAEITEADAIGWVKDSMGAEAITALEESIAAQITESKTPATVAGVPW